MSLEDQNDGRDPTGAGGAASDQTDADYDKAFDEFASDEGEPSGGDDHEDRAADADNDDLDADDGAQGDEGAGGSDADASDREDNGSGKSGSEASTPDIWANATAEQKADLEALRKKVSDAETTAKRHTNQVPGLQRRINELEAEIRRRDEKPGRGSDDGKDTPAGELFEGDDWKDLEADYPGVAQAIKATIGTQSTQLEQLRGQVGTLDETRQNAIYEQNFAAVVQQHPDFEKIGGSDGFKAWAEKQPQFIRDGIERNYSNIVDPNEASRIIGLYKADNGIGQSGKEDQNPSSGKGGDKQQTSSKRQRQLESGASVDSRGPGTPSGPPDAFDDAFDFYAKQQEKR